MNEHLFQLLLVLAAGAVGAMPGAIRSWRSDVRAEGASSSDLATLTKGVGKLEGRIEELETDFGRFAEGTRKRFERLEKKEQALEQHVTGRMPRISGEGPTQ